MRGRVYGLVAFFANDKHYLDSHYVYIILAGTDISHLTVGDICAQARLWFFFFQLEKVIDKTNRIFFFFVQISDKWCSDCSLLLLRFLCGSEGKYRSRIAEKLIAFVLY